MKKAISIFAFAAVAASATIPARAKTFSVRTETTSSNTTFVVARPDNTTEEIVHYRIVSRSALVGLHLTNTGGTCNIPFPTGFLTPTGRRILWYNCAYMRLCVHGGCRWAT